MLKDMEAILGGFEVDFYVVGAAARDYHLSAKKETAALRKTNDIDLAIMLNDAGQFNQIKDALIESGNFTADPSEHIKLYYKKGLEVDLIPFGKIESANGFIFLQPPNMFTLNMPGFKEIYPFVEEVSFDDGLSVKICTVEGIVILKLIAYRDRPSRTKDIADIEHIIAVYFELSEENIYEEHFDVMNIYSVENSDYLQLVSARVIGRKMQVILKESEDLRILIKSVLEKRQEDWAEALTAGIDDVP
jgi:predicted nucleotidyltransferase